MDEQIYELIGQFVILIFSGVGGAFLLLKFYGKTWIEHSFSKDLAAFKAQKLHEFDILFNQKIRWQEKQYEVLSISWTKLIDANAALRRAVSLLKETPDFNGKTNEEIQSYLDDVDFNDREREYFESEQDKNKAYLRIMGFRETQEAHIAFSEFHKYFEHNKIFLQDNIKEKFEAVDTHIRDAWISKKMSLDEHEKNKFNLEAYKTVKDIICTSLDKI